MPLESFDQCTPILLVRSLDNLSTPKNGFPFKTIRILEDLPERECGVYLGPHVFRDHVSTTRQGNKDGKKQKAKNLISHLDAHLLY